MFFNTWGPLSLVFEPLARLVRLVAHVLGFRRHMCLYYILWRVILRVPWSSILGFGQCRFQV